MSTDRFDIAVQFQSSTSTENDYGEDIATYTNAFKLGCQVQQYSAQRSFENNQAEVSGDAVFVTTRRNRNTNKVDTNYRAIIDGQTFRITGVDKVAFRRNTIRFICDVVE